MKVTSQDEVLGYFETLSNHGRWGADDMSGTLNLITPEKSVSAGQLMRTGRSASCAWEFDNASIGEVSPPHRFMMRTGEATHTQSERQYHVVEYHGIAPHGYRITHVDAPSHVTYDGKLYNGFPATAITPDGGATVLDVVPMGHGVITRGILLDVPKHRGEKWTELGEMVHVDEVQSILDAEGLQVTEGDALMLRTGNDRRMIEEGFDHVMSLPGPGGFDPSCAPFFHDHGVSIIGADMPNDRNHTDYPEVHRPIHALCIYVMGMWLIDNCDFTDLAKLSAEVGTAEFALFMAAVPFRGATGYPVSPIAVF